MFTHQSGFNLNVDIVPYPFPVQTQNRRAQEYLGTGPIGEAQDPVHFLHAADRRERRIIVQLLDGSRPGGGRKQSRLDR